MKFKFSMSQPFWAKTLAFVLQNPIPGYNFEIDGEEDRQTIKCTGTLAGPLYSLKAVSSAPSDSGYTTIPVITGMATLLGGWTDKEFSDKLNELFNIVDSGLKHEMETDDSTLPTV